jgi:hypothetical protein
LAHFSLICICGSGDLLPSFTLRFFYAGLTGEGDFQTIDIAAAVERVFTRQSVRRAINGGSLRKIQGTTQVDRLNARDSQADYLRFLTMAFGSLRELHYQIGLSKRLGFLNNQDFSSFESKVVETEKILNGLIRALREG